MRIAVAFSMITGSFDWSMGLWPTPCISYSSSQHTARNVWQVQMSILKRKREIGDEGNQDLADDTAVVADATAQEQQQNEEESNVSSRTACSSTQEPGEETQRRDGKEVEAMATSNGDAPPASAAMSSTNEPPVKIVICGKEIVLKGTGGRKKRKHPLETLIILAYKGRLAIACKDNDMVAALDIYREMKSKGIKRDLSVHQMVLAVCGGSPGDKDELDPGNGATAASPAEGTTSRYCRGSAAGTGDESGSAQNNPTAAAEAALQIFSEASKDGAVRLPESAYTGVIRACCLDDRADTAREMLEKLKKTGEKPRLRTYAALLETYARLDGRLQDCMGVWRDGVSSPQSLTLSEREYLYLITACTRARDEKCFLEVMVEYMEDVLQPRSRQSWEVLKAWFEVANEDCKEADTDTAAVASEVEIKQQDAGAEQSVVARGSDADSKSGGGATEEGGEDGDGAVVAGSACAAADVSTPPPQVKEMEDAAAICVAGSCSKLLTPGDDEEVTPTPVVAPGSACAVVDGSTPPPQVEEMEDAAAIDLSGSCSKLATPGDNEEMIPIPVVAAGSSACAAVDGSTPPPLAKKTEDAPAGTGVSGSCSKLATPGDDEGMAETNLVATDSIACAAVDGSTPPPQAEEMEDAAAIGVSESCSKLATPRDDEMTPTLVIAAGSSACAAVDSSTPPSVVEETEDAAAAVGVSGSCSKLDIPGDDEGVTSTPAAPSSPLRPPSSAVGGRWRVSECKVGKDGACGNCGEVLKSIELSEDDEQRLLKQTEVLVCTNEQRTTQWEGYRGWLERRGKERYNVIIDGANVGYFKKNAGGAGELADLEQVDWVVKKYEAEGKKPLVVLHSRHLVEKRLSAEAKAILERWNEEGLIQSCAPKNNDDWYWLYAAVYAGGRVLVLTNDEMRDHHFSMLSHRSFQRWKERHQTRFWFGDWTDDDTREVITEEPSSYSKRTQKGEASWHIPLEGSDDWLCVTRQHTK